MRPRSASTERPSEMYLQAFQVPGGFPVERVPPDHHHVAVLGLQHEGVERGADGAALAPHRPGHGRLQVRHAGFPLAPGAQVLPADARARPDLARRELHARVGAVPGRRVEGGRHARHEAGRLLQFLRGIAAPQGASGQPRAPDAAEARGRVIAGGQAHGRIGPLDLVQRRAVPRHPDAETGARRIAGMEGHRVFRVLPAEGEAVHQRHAQRRLAGLRHGEQPHAPAPYAPAVDAHRAGFRTDGQARVEPVRRTASGRMGETVENHVHPWFEGGQVGLVPHGALQPVLPEKRVAAVDGQRAALGDGPAGEVQRGLDDQRPARAAVRPVARQQLRGEGRQVVQHRVGSSCPALSLIPRAPRPAAPPFA